MTPRRHRSRRALGVLGILGAFVLGAPAQATEPVWGVPNTCEGFGGQGTPCLDSNACKNFGFATACVEHVLGQVDSRRCEIPCKAGEGAGIVPVPSDCALGETCVEGKEVPNLPQKTFFCKPASFRVDLNLLDQCIVSYLEGFQPVQSANSCSLEASLDQLLDQNGDHTFDIFDFDLCILAFLEQPGCTFDDGLGAWTTDDPDLVCCAADDACGQGLYCSPDSHVCQRDCGLIASREEGLDAFERQCSGALKTCDYARGRCELIDPTLASCDVDADCPAGAYCFLGRCAPSCYRALDCPSGPWLCDQTNRCRAKPHPQADAAFQFEPRNYAIRFARESLKLDAMQTYDQSELLIMDLRTKRQVLGNPSVTFGYRLEASYSLKQDRKCLRPFVDCTDPEARPSGETEAACTARQDDCYIEPAEEWIRLTAPFGTISGAARDGVRIELEEAVADALSTGVYPATLRIIFDNGDADSLPVTLVKSSPSGEYSGTLTVYIGTPDNALNGNRPLLVGLRMRVEEQTTTWHDLLVANHLDVDEDLLDLTGGYVVSAQLHGNTSFAFTRTGVTDPASNEIPFVGLYSPDQGRVRLIGVIEVAPSFCISEDGAPCKATDETQLKVKNPFGRRIRRQIEFIGPFDESLGRFHGLYREKISGLAADYDVTLDGGFILNQTMADDSPIAASGPLLAAGAPAVAFPDDAAVLQQLESDLASTCGTDAQNTIDYARDAADGVLDRSSRWWAWYQFQGPGQFATYLAQARRRGPVTEFSTEGKTTIFPGLVEFDQAIQQALSALGTDAGGQQAYLNVYDFLSSRMLPCDASDPSPPPACIDETTARCGLALYQKAYLKGWINLDAVDETGENDLVCPETMPLVGCPDTAEGSEDLFALQEHNRFWWDLGQILKFDGDRARSDAFLVLFRNEVNTFTQQAALSYKTDRIREAVARYDQLIREIAGPAAAKVLFQWPAIAFKQWGYDWLGVMYDIASGRMSALAELLDLEQRVYGSTGDRDFVFAQHMMQHEYLFYVYLMALQARWQGQDFGYLGWAGPQFQKGQAVLNQLNPERGPLGQVPGRVYFENANADTNNWKNYRNILVGLGGDGGMLGAAQQTVTDAVAEMKAALADLDTLQEKLQESRFELEDKLNELCGDPAIDQGRYCNALAADTGYEEWAHLRDCLLADYTEASPTDCPDDVAFVCESFSNKLDGANDCESVAEAFVATTNTRGGDSGNPIYGDTCILPASEEARYIEVNGTRRACVGGQMGEKLGEKAALKLKQRITLGSVQKLLTAMNTFALYAAETADKKDQIKQFTLAYQWVAWSIDTALRIVVAIDKVFNKGLEDVSECTVVMGLAFGTNCIGVLAESASKIIATTIEGIIKESIVSVSNVLGIAKDTAIAEWQTDIDQLATGLDQRTRARDIGGLMDEFFTTSQELVNLSAQIDNLHYQAQAAADRYDEKVTFVAEHLVGRETGNLLAGDQMVADASDAFHDVLLVAYKLVVAFIHNYNVAPGDATTLVNQSLACVTLDDVAGLVADLDDRERDYCGLEGIDCDAATNVEVLRFSFRERLFPQLHDLIDAHTGKVVTAGEQFHNLITQPPYVKRRVRGTELTDQIELPMDIPVQFLENTKDGTPHWLIDPLTCNHLLDARDPLAPTTTWSSTGTVAVNVVGQGFGPGGNRIRYELVRGAIDFIRACQPESVVEEVGTLPVLQYPTRKHIVGYAPQSSQALAGEPESFVTRSAAFTACMNKTEQAGGLADGDCWRFFARDRSLASPDWKLVVPLRIGGASSDNTWLLGEGLPEDQRPLIEDIVVYFRYRTRPIQEN